MAELKAVLKLDLSQLKSSLKGLSIPGIGTSKGGAGGGGARAASKAQDERKKTNKGIGGMLKGLAGILGAVVGLLAGFKIIVGLLQILANLANILAPIIVTILKPVLIILALMATALLKFLKDPIGALQGLFAGIGNLFSGGDIVLGHVEEQALRKKLQEAGKSADEIDTIIQEVKDNTRRTFIDGASTLIGGLIGAFFGPGGVVAGAAIGAAVGKLINLMIDNWPAIVASFSEMWADLKDYFSTSLQDLKNIFSSLATGISEIFTLAIEGLGALISGDFETAGVKIGKIWDTVLKLFSDIWPLLASLLFLNIKIAMAPLFLFGPWLWKQLKSIIKSTLSFFGGDEEKEKKSISGIFGDDPTRKTTKVNDLIITPQGRFSTSPQDTIIATKNPQALGGGGGGNNISVTLNNTFTGAVDRKNAKDFSNEVMRIVTKRMGEMIKQRGGL